MKLIMVAAFIVGLLCKLRLPLLWFLLVEIGIFCLVASIEYNDVGAANAALIAIAALVVSQVGFATALVMQYLMDRTTSRER